MARAKIICTMGPSTRDPGIIAALAASGMNVARINFSHGVHEEIKKTIENVRKVSAETGNPIAILGDLAGPKIRVGELESEFVTLEEKQEFTITTREIVGNASIVSTTYPNLVSDVDSGNSILIDDGSIELMVEEVRPEEVRTRVVIGGNLYPRKGINLPGVAVSAPAISAKDFSDTEFAVREGFDLLALSFVRSPDDVTKIKRILTNLKSDMPVIAKIEKQEAVKSFDRVLDRADGIMIARGDLGVEMASEQVPLIQKQIIHQCNKAGKPVITATQMLESMMRNPRPTRAETSDVANAVMDGSDAVMLSGETAVGRYPIQAVDTMRKIVHGVEKEMDRHRRVTEWPHDSTIEEAVTAAACRAAEILNAKAIVAYTQSGSTAMRISKYRPSTKILAITPLEHIRRRLCLFWGVKSSLVEGVLDTEAMINTAEKVALKSGFARSGNIIVITSGTPVGEPGTTNLVHVHRIK